MAQTINDALARAELRGDDKSYLLVALPPARIAAAAGVIAQIAAPYCALIADRDEVTLLLTTDAWDAYSARLPGHRVSEIRYRLITFDVELELDLVGFMARVSAALANAGVPILTYGAYTRDHIFVPAGQFDTAWAVLEQLQARARSEQLE